MRRWLAALLLASAVVAFATAAGAETYVVQVGATEFTPASITITKSDVIRWEWVSGPSQVLASGEGPDDLDAGQVWDNIVVSGQNTTVDHAFGQAGVYKYFSRTHPSMKGTITVLAGPAPVNRQTWSYLKKMFEGAAKSRR